MPHCAVSNCKNTSKTVNRSKGGISFHGFPMDPETKSKWIDATGLKDWFPSKNSTICSAHFKEEDYSITNKWRRLFPNAFPTVEVWNWSTNISESPILKNVIEEPDQIRKRTKLDIALPRELAEPSTSQNINTTPKRRKINLSNSERLQFDNLADAPRIKKLRSDLERSKSAIVLKMKQIKRLREQTRRRNKKTCSLVAVLNDLKKKSLLNIEEAEMLQSMDIKVKELYWRQQKNKYSVSQANYSPALRSFALTLNYYSPKAYNYVRQTFYKSLPHPRTIRKWYESVDGNPGFTKESLNAITLKQMSVGHPLFFCLTIDEMAIRRKVEWDGKHFHGYVDFGDTFHSDQACECKEALVFLLTCINGNFKVPIGYFLVDGVSALQKKNLLITCLELLQANSITVVALTFDGCASNLAMAKLLGCCLEPSRLKTIFKHPVTNEPVAILLDTCHMLKLIKNTLQVYKKIYTEDVPIEWSYLEKLHGLQEMENFHGCNKLRRAHINFYNQKMKVKLASQLLSNSVADTLEMCRDKLKIDEFQDCGSTIHFIRIFNNLFDVLNSRSLKTFNFKKPLTLNNKESIYTFLLAAENYIKSLKNGQGSPILATARKTGFLGFLVDIHSTRHLFEYLVEKEHVDFLSTYRFSKDHIELFFCNVRSHDGHRNDPTSRQFKSYYKKLITHVEIKHTERGNCIDLERISILNCSAIETINVSTSRRTMVDTPEEQNAMDDFSFNESLDFSNFSCQVIIYISGYVASYLIKKIKCDVCVGALVSSDEWTKKLYLYTLITFKDKGGLIYPSSDVVKICKMVESVVKYVVDKNQNFALKPKQFKSIIVNKAIAHFVGNKIFDSISYHQFEQCPTENHLVHLVKAIAERYLDVRFRYITNLKRPNITKGQMFNI